MGIRQRHRRQGDPGCNGGLPGIGEILNRVRHRLRHLQGGHLPPEGRGIHPWPLQRRRGKNRNGNKQLSEKSVKILRKF